MNKLIQTIRKIALMLLALVVVFSVMSPVEANSSNFTIWPANTVPGLIDGGADSPVELGVKFSSDVDGYITGIRFYKASTNTGTHVGNLWTSSGDLLATATFINESASGWQQVNFTTPVVITANTVYVASYHVNNGHYSADVSYFTGKGMDSPPLYALASGVSGLNGVYAYGTASNYPTQNWRDANYWVDVVLSATPPVPVTLSSMTVAPANSTITTGSSQQFTATGFYSNGTSQDLTSQVTWASADTGVATIIGTGLSSGVSAGSSTITATLNGVTGSTSLTVQAIPLAILTTALPDGVQNVPYSTALIAQGGVTPYTWSITSGSLPSGLSLDSSTGIISGIPTATGAFTVTVQAAGSDSPQQTATRALTLSISTQVVLSSITVAPANPTIAIGDSQQFAATGFYSDGTSQDLTSQVTWASADTAVATIIGTGLSSGVSAGSSTITATLNGVTGSTSLTVQAIPLAILTTALPDGVQNVPYSTALIAQGGVTPYTWSITSGSLPSGLSLDSSTGVISGIPTATGAFTVTVQAAGSDSPQQTAIKVLNLSVSTQANFTIWPANTVPGLIDGGADSPVELGVKFSSDVDGYITGIRFYKASTNTGTHVGNLWTSSGDLLATATFINESASGWQQVNFTTPVVITANTVYVASYHVNNGHYSADVSYFTGKGMDSPPLYALASGVSGLNGVYAYGTASNYPTQNWRDANYWVDVVLSATPPVPVTLSSMTVAPANSTITTGSSQQFTATGFYSNGTSQDLTSQVTWASADTGVATIIGTGLSSGVSAGSSTITATLNGVTGSTSLTVQAIPLAILTTALPDGVQNVPYSTALIAQGGVTPYTWSITSGSLPSGLSLDSSTGVISGIPTATGAFTVTVQAAGSDSPQQTATRALTLSISTQVVLSSITVAPANPTIAIGDSQQFAATGFYSDGTSQDLTSQVTWASADTAVATIIGTGLSSGVSAGSSTITATLNGVTGSTSLTVQATTTLPEPADWFAGDMHVHRSCGDTPETIESIQEKMVPQNLSFVSLLADMGNGEVQDPVMDLPRVTGFDDPVSTPERIVHWDAEWHWDAVYNQYPHQALGGHVLALGVSGAYQIWEESTYQVFDWAHQQGGIAGFAHMQYLPDGIPQELNCCGPIEYPVEVALGASDFISEDVIDVNYSSSSMDPESTTRAYYRLLNTGFRPGLAAGTDYPCGGSGELGALLTYVNVQGAEMTYDNWIAGIAAGRTVISRNGHNEFLELRVNDTATPGDEVELTEPGRVQVTMRWTSKEEQAGTIELVQNGNVIASIPATASPDSPVNVSTTVDFTKSGWLAARRMGSAGRYVHTAAVFVTVADAPVRVSVEDAQFYVDWMDNLLEKTAPGGEWNSFFEENLAEAQARYQAAKEIYQQIALEASQQESFSITTQDLPAGIVNLPYASTVTSSGGTQPFTWSITNGSLPSGLSLDSYTGIITGIPIETGTFTVTVQAADSGSPQQIATKVFNISISSTQANFTIWPANTVPGLIDGGADSPVELGVKFSSDVDGYITGIRFYKASTNTGTHVGNLWTSSGDLLATATFINESASGWQQVNFTTPVVITANTVYVASYHVNNGHYSADVSYFTGKGMDSPPLYALASGVSGLNGVYAYGTASNYPTQNWRDANYWVDVVLSATPPVPVTLSSMTVAPANSTITTGSSQQFTATGFYSNGTSQDLTSQVTWASADTAVATIIGTGLSSGVSAGSSTITATLNGVTGSTSLTVQAIPLAILTTALPDGVQNVPYSTALIAQGGVTPYTWSITSGSLPSGLSLDSSTGIISGIPTFSGALNFSVQASDSGLPDQNVSQTFTMATSTSRPILIISSESNPFSSYYAEILRTEGLNEFVTIDISSVSSTVLINYDVAILGEMPLASTQVEMLSNWLSYGGNLIAMRPDKQLANLLGLSDQAATLSDAYLLVNTSESAGVGIVDQTIQFHGTADLYTGNGALNLATIYSDASTETVYPAVTLNSVGTSGGLAAAFTYDLARSVVSTRQGNQAWAGQNRDGDSLIRADDLFYGAASFDPQPDWIDLNKVDIPQADEQQRLLANLIIQMNIDKKPLPRFWYLPRMLAAAVVMTGDDHGRNGTEGRFDDYIALSPPDCSIEEWECIRSTSYIYPYTPLSNEQAAFYEEEGFEVSAHISTDCYDWTPTTLKIDFADELDLWSGEYPSLSQPVTNRNHCVPWSDFVTMPKVQLEHGIRLDTNYYYYPPTWISDRPGFFTGSGIPMRFADIDGTIIDVFQAPTQMTDESGQSYPFTIDSLLDKAIGPEGYYGFFVANIHTDTAYMSESDAIISSATTRGIPVISARQMLTWLDGRNASSFESIAWNGTVLSFKAVVAPGATGMFAMVPMVNGLNVTNILSYDVPITFTVATIKGIAYALFPVVNGDYLINYDPN